MSLSYSDLRIGMKVKCIYDNSCHGKIATIIRFDERFHDIKVKWDDGTKHSTHWGDASSFKAVNDRDAIDSKLEDEQLEDDDDDCDDDDIKPVKQVKAAIALDDPKYAVQERACSMCMRPNPASNKVCWCCDNPPFLTRE
jgi:hypothetical protein